MNATCNSNSAHRARRSGATNWPAAGGTSARLTRRLRRAWREGFAAALGVALTIGLWNSQIPGANADEPAPLAQDASASPTSTTSTTASPDSAKTPDPAKTPVAAPATAKAESPAATPVAAAKIETSKDAPRTLSVEPTPERRPFSYDKSKRPAWVDQGVQHSGETQFTVVTSGPRVTDREAQRGLDEEIVKAVRDYVGEYLDSPTAAEVLPLSLRDIKARMRSDQFYVELVEFDIGPMYIAYALVEFNPEFRSDLEQRWQNLVSYGRVATFGVGIGAIFLVLGSLLTYLRVDTATRGYYTRRLQLATVTTILAVVTAGVVLARHFFLI